ncbi:acetyl-CoA synthetase-like protein [Ascobolus immersus RN42]|uniref:Acetyl-CoA synthetase-like protein n=1 Tax=Ascobolus immersus RN42 TaxID=1160509 RepID=A0A3N4IAQ3_ASCIM|nr:acetyl-CoA synthetase-like protein [Ascobolus immersus RN42]
MVQDPILVKSRHLKMAPPAPQKHGVALPGTEKPNRTPIYRHWRKEHEPLMVTMDPTIRTMHEMFEHSVRLYSKNKCLGWRPRDPKTGTFGPYQWLTYGDVQTRRINFGAGLAGLYEKFGVTGKDHGVGLWSQNRPEWQITDLALTCRGFFTVSIYDTLGPDTTEYIINHAELTGVVTTLSHVPSLLSIAPRCPTLKFIVVIEELDENELPGSSKASLLKAWAAEKGLEIYSMSEVEAMGVANPRELVIPVPEDTVTINYTSGTTGAPKGVVLTHANAIAAASSGHTSVIHMEDNDVMLSYLPLAHIYGRLGEHIALWAGAAIGFFHGDILGLADDIKLLRPTIFFSVPRLFQRFGTAIKAATVEAPGVKGALSRHVVNTKLQNMKTSGSNSHAFYDRIWAKKVQAGIGLDRCHGMVSGSAPISPELLQFLRVTFANNFMQGYGLTETYAVGMGQLAQDNTAGSCGPPTYVTEACLQDVPEMGYTKNDKGGPRGELLLRGTTCFKEYYKSPEQTKATIDEDGWVHTGDICSIDDMGRFTIIDRVKNLLKLAQGEYVSPERIENNFLANSNLFAQAYVYGDSFKSFLVAVFGVDPETFIPFAEKVLRRPITKEELPTVLEDTKVRVAVVKVLDRIIKKTKFNKFEAVKNVHLCIEPFSIQNELLTPT